MKLKTPPRLVGANGRCPRAATAAFTLIEMIGVLAVIAILAALLIPRVFEAINNARINNAVVSCSTLKAAIADHYAKFGSIQVDGTATPPQALNIPPLPAAYTNYDRLLLNEGFLDRPFQVKIGDGDPASTKVQVRFAAPAAQAVTADNSAYDLAGASTNSALGSVVVEAVIGSVILSDAKDLNDRLDGPTLGAVSGDDLKGRVKYSSASPTTTVYVYLTHR